MKPLMIGSVIVDPPLVLAPMAGVTNHAFRLMCKQAGGCGLVSTEMISAYALCHNHQRTRAMMDWSEDERPVSAQIFGAHPEIVADGARIVQEAGADIIEINMGCPAPKVVKTGAGAALLRDPDRAARMVAAVSSAVEVPVTVKMRIGWDTSNIVAERMACLCEDNGVSAVTVHARTVSQGYAGEADWNIIKRVKESLSIPVIGNGDVRTGEQARLMFDATQCDGVMIGRAALGDPWVFARIAAYLHRKIKLPEPSFRDRIEGARQHLRLLADLFGDDRAAREMRGHVAWYLKGINGAAVFRAKIMACRSTAEIERVLDEASCQC